MSLLEIANLKGKVKRRDERIAELEARLIAPPTEPQIQAGMKAMLQCSASDLESMSPQLLDIYKNELVTVYNAMCQKQTRN